MTAAPAREGGPVPSRPRRAGADPGATDRLRIGDVAREAGVSTRTVRYYEQVGLLEDVGRTAGGTRTYGKRDVEVLLRIRELQTLLGFDLDQIGTILAAERRMDELRAEWRADSTAPRQQELLQEAMDINRRLRAEVDAKLTELRRFRRDLDAKATRYRAVAEERGLDVAGN